MNLGGAMIDHRALNQLSASPACLHCDALLETLQEREFLQCRGLSATSAVIFRGLGSRRTMNDTEAMMGNESHGFLAAYGSHTNQSSELHLDCEC